MHWLQVKWISNGREVGLLEQVNMIFFRRLKFIYDPSVNNFSSAFLAYMSTIKLMVLSFPINPYAFKIFSERWLLAYLISLLLWYQISYSLAEDTLPHYQFWLMLRNLWECQKKKEGTLVHERSLSSNVSVPGERLMRRISASLKESSLTVADVRGRMNVGTIPDNPLDDRVNLFEHKILVAWKSRLRPSLFEMTWKSVPRNSMPAILVLLSPKNFSLMSNDLFWSRIPFPLLASLVTSNPLWIS